MLIPVRIDFLCLRLTAPPEVQALGPLKEGWHEGLRGEGHRPGGEGERIHLSSSLERENVNVGDFKVSPLRLVTHVHGTNCDKY